MNAIVPASSKIRDLLKNCNLLGYYDRFMAEGFDQLESLLDVTESDLIAMDVKRGHRRRLQREIATIKGVPINMPLCIQHGSGLEDSSDGQMHSTSNVIRPSPLNHDAPTKILYVNGTSGSNCSAVESSLGSTRDDPPDPTDKGSSTKRKYKRHPKRDKNAPVKPLSAYVMFAHKVREEFAGQNISFPDMAKIVGDRWKNVRPEVKEKIENEAAKKKEEYQSAMSVYKTTDGWKKYQEYLKEFKEKYESNSRESSKRKRQKIEPTPDSPSGYSSTRSGYENASGNTSSGSSNGNGNGNGGHHVKPHQFPTGPYGSPHSTNYVPPPYPHSNPTVPYGYTSRNNGQIIGASSFVTPPSSINTNNGQQTTLADLYAKDDSNAGDDQSQLGNTSSSGNGSGNGSGHGSSGSSSRDAERQSFEDSSDNSTTSSSNNTPPAVPMETDDNQEQRFQNQNNNQNQDNVAVDHSRSQSHQY